MASKFEITGILAPGKINTFVKGSFRDVLLYEAADDILLELYNNGNPYVRLSSASYSVPNKQKKAIGVKEFKGKNKI
jgi:hypothetical protein